MGVTPLWAKALAAVVPVFLAALVTIAWQNSHALAVIGQRIEQNEKQVDHLRELVEIRLACPPAVSR